MDHPQLPYSRQMRKSLEEPKHWHTRFFSSILCSASVAGQNDLESRRGDHLPLRPHISYGTRGRFMPSLISICRPSGSWDQMDSRGQGNVEYVEPCVETIIRKLIPWISMRISLVFLGTVWPPRIHVKWRRDSLPLSSYVTMVPYFENLVGSIVAGRQM